MLITSMTLAMAGTAAYGFSRSKANTVTDRRSPAPLWPLPFLGKRPLWTNTGQIRFRMAAVTIHRPRLSTGWEVCWKMHPAMFHIDFLTQDGHHLGYARITVQLAFAPSTEIEYEHGAWHDPRRASSVSFDLQESTFFVRLGVDELESRDDIKAHADMYRAHGWDVT